MTVSTAETDPTKIKRVIADRSFAITHTSNSGPTEPSAVPARR
jgi:hypothetical protein